MGRSINQKSPMIPLYANRIFEIMPSQIPSQRAPNSLSSFALTIQLNSTLLLRLKSPTVCIIKTCLSKGKDFYFPSCHMIDVCGFRLLINCPMDLSALSIFSPAGYLKTKVVAEDDDHLELTSDAEGIARKRQKVEKVVVDASDLINAVPWYKVVGNLALWNIASVDIVLISSPMAMLGLPFLTQMDGFCAKVYATEATVKLGEIMMGDILSLYMEFRQIYGPEESDFPDWLKWDNLEKLPSTLAELAYGEGGVELNSWMPLYSAEHVKDCVKKIRSLKYAEEACYNGTLIITAFSSGLEIGACNWRLNGPSINYVCLSASIFTSTHATDFDFQILQKSDLVLFSDVLSLHLGRDVDNQEASSKSLSETDESRKEIEKLAFISSCIVESVRCGGSILIPIGRLGHILLLLEQISTFLESSNLKVPMYFISSVAKELLGFTNTIPEWLSKERQEKLFSSCEPLFGHADLIKEKKLHLLPTIYSLDLMKTWQEPCIVFAPHWSLRLGPVVHLLQRWRGDQNSLLVMEEGPDADLSLLPFMPMAMKVLQCSFISEMRLSKIDSLLEVLQTKHVLLPEELRHIIRSTRAALPYSVTHYSEGETVTVPYRTNNSVLEITRDEASKLHFKKTKRADTSIAQVTGDLSAQLGKHRLLPSADSTDTTQSASLFFWGSPDPQTLQSKLKEAGLTSTVETNRNNNAFDTHITEPGKALVQVRETSTVISAGTQHLASLIYDAVASCLDSI